MIKLKNKPRECKDCPFCYRSSKYSYQDVGVKEEEVNYCGVRRDCASIENCPLD